MKTILTSVLAGSLLATLAVAQPSRSTSARADPRAQLWRARISANSAAPRADAIPAAASDSRLVYVITLAFQFGVLDLRSGTFLPIGPGLPPDVGTGLVPGRGASLLSLGFTGNLDAIDPVTGITSVVGATGLHDCSLPVDPYDPKCANIIGRFDGTVYVTDFANNLYSADSATGAARLIGPTGIPPLTFVPFTANPDGSVNIYGESLFSARGKFYAYFSAVALNFETGAKRILTPGALYQLNPATGHTTFIAPTDSNLTSIVNVNDTLYGFDAAAAQVVTLDLTTGQTTAISQLDPAASVIPGATPARPSPAAGH
jgi:hypothetical protein